MNRGHGFDDKGVPCTSFVFPLLNLFSACALLSTVQGKAAKIDRKHQNRVRAYERSKLRYYYCIIETDSVETAEHLYQECDGVELERTACKFDLRYVDDDEVFDHAEPRDVCTSLSMATASKSKDDQYSGLDFECKALQLTGVQCSWDVTDRKRTKILKRNFSEGAYSKHSALCFQTTHSY